MRFAVKVSDSHGCTLDRFAIDADSQPAAFAAARARVADLIASGAVSRGTGPLRLSLAPEAAAAPVAA